MISRDRIFYTLGALSLIGAALFPIGYITSFNIFISLFIIGILLILIAQKRKMDYSLPFGSFWLQQERLENPNGT
ncbi:hypothetical protein [Bacillus sp. mrc49]|uniref:hypothetical protein n=1 Tax=Bacillus sp. mrc49 TaxID=2054913 RepID=UPI000C280499|nr:hypothetical protein [Bacillus sp. mrc49]PJN87874.1 hypothetical protein CVN76_23575 [Bacillus sp. mrc49]